MEVEAGTFEESNPIIVEVSYYNSSKVNSEEEESYDPEESSIRGSHC